MRMTLKIHYIYFLITIFVFSITVTSIQIFAVEEIWEDYKKMGEMVKDIRNGDKDDDKVDYNKFKNSTVYKNAKEDVRNCIDLANRVGEKLGDYEIVHCFENTNYFKEKYVDDEAQNTQDVNRQEAETQTMTQSKSASDADLSEQEQKPSRLLAPALLALIGGVPARETVRVAFKVLPVGERTIQAAEMG